MHPPTQLKLKTASSTHLPIFKQGFQMLYTSTVSLENQPFLYVWPSPCYLLCSQHTPMFLFGSTDKGPINHFLHVSFRMYLFPPCREGPPGQEPILATLGVGQLSEKGPTAHIFNFLGYRTLVTTIQLYHCSQRAAETVCA